MRAKRIVGMFTLVVFIIVVLGLSGCFVTQFDTENSEDVVVESSIELERLYDGSGTEIDRFYDCQAEVPAQCYVFRGFEKGGIFCFELPEDASTC